ncbi:MAG TPA: hypothetical protein VG798_02575 [Rhizomicrobium sp.]|nr:hypothetical protein [Rhizomicrobium sp.]
MRSSTGLGILFSALVISATVLSASAAPGDACALLTTQQAAVATGVAMGAGAHVTPTFVKTCTWVSAGDNPHEIATLSFLDPQAFAAGRVPMVKSITVTPASGIGDGAYYVVVGSLVTLMVKKGNVVLKAALYAEIPLDKIKAIEKAMALQALNKI